MIIGTAGHTDHGKTTLVRALTGVDTDRLKEEKERGISIELGYAYTPLENGDVLGYIDVPGHERLVHTMVAGACGIDFALIVVAADDGVMPQTLEHLAILDLLGVTQGAVALSKIDRVDSGRLRQAQTEVESTLASSGLRNAPVFPLNAAAMNDPGTQSLKRYLHEMAARTSLRHSEGLFRLAVDRVFTLAGQGTVVTGTVFSGQVNVGDTVTVMPAGTQARVRSIHAQNRPAEMGRAGQRCALNLAGIEKSAITRGDWLADPRALAPTTRIDVRMRLLSHSAIQLGPWSPIHFHSATTHRVAHVVLLESEAPHAGDSVRVQLVFAKPLCVTAGDRFIARDAQAAKTLGGGTVLDPFAPSRKRRSEKRLRYLDALEKWVAGEGLEALLQQAPFGIKISDLVRLSGRILKPSSESTDALPARALVIDAGHDPFVILSSHWHALRNSAVDALRNFHTQVPDEPGPDVSRLRRISFPELPDILWCALVDELVRNHVIARSGAWLHLPEHVVQLSDDEQVLARKLQPLIAAGRFNPPWVRDLATRVNESEDRVRDVLCKQVTQGAVFQVVRDLFYDSDCIGELANVITALARQHGGVDAAHYRDAIGLGRKRAIQILEFFDRVGYTRRIHDSHLLRSDSGWTPHERGH